MLDGIFEIFKMIFVALKIFFRIIEIFFIIIIGLIIFYPGKVYNLTYIINEDYVIQKEDVLNDKEVVLYSDDYSSEDHESKCFYVDKFTKVKDYYIGHFDGTVDKKRCSRYFYIKKDNTDKKFDVSISEIIEKFGNVEFKYTPDEYIDKYGEK